MKYLKSFILALVVVFGVSGCGGGAGGGYNPSSGIFPSNSSLARKNDANAKELIDILIGHNINAMIPRSKVVGDTQNSKEPTIMHLAIKEIKTLKSAKTAKAYRVTDISDDYCEEGELLKDDISSNEIKYTYNNCLQNGYYYDGVIVRKVNRASNRLEIKYEDFRVDSEYGNSSLFIKGGSKIVLEDLGSNRYKIELNIVYSANKKRAGFKDVVFIYNDNEKSMYQTKGRVYLNDLQEYAEFDDRYDMSNTPLLYDEDNNIYSGEFYYKFRGWDLHVIIDDGVTTYSWE